MNSEITLVLKRNDFSEQGTFGQLLDYAGVPIAVTLEHSYNGAPKIPAGTYVCVRGRHRLASMPDDFTTFEITGVPGHSNILFHCGNYNSDSEGCVLLGVLRDENMILHSKIAFSVFMQILEDASSFTLKVI